MISPELCSGVSEARNQGTPKEDSLVVVSAAAWLQRCLLPGPQPASLWACSGLRPPALLCYYIISIFSSPPCLLCALCDTLVMNSISAHAHQRGDLFASKKPEQHTPLVLIIEM